ncbi:MAG: cell division protein FtsW [Sedimentisphaerales bacterium]|nr:cell division protein FtsW [Sedimentisphaerales bacterium]
MLTESKTINSPDQRGKTAEAHPSALGGWLLIIISTLLCLGALMVFSAGAGIGQKLEIERFWEFSTLRRIAFVPLAWLVLAVFSRVGYRRWLVWENHFWLSPVVWFTALSIILLVVVLIPGFGHAMHGSFRWFKFKVGPAEITFQPSELAKWFVVMFLAAYAAYRGGKMRNFKVGFVPGCAVLGLVVALIGKEDFGTAALVGGVGMMVLLVGGVRWYQFLVLVPLIAGAFYLMVYRVDYRWARVTGWLGGDDPNAVLDSSYQARQSLTAIASGGIWGKGLGNGTMKFGWVPEDTTDFVFAIIGEELGFVGCAIVIGLFVVLMVCGILIVNRASDPLGMFLAVAITGTIGAQAVMNLMVVTSLAPTKGIALPFISAGGSGLLLTAMAAGVLVNVAKHGRVKQKKPTG